VRDKLCGAAGAAELEAFLAAERVAAEAEAAAAELEPDAPDETSGTDSHLCLPPTCQGVLNFWNVRDYVTREAFRMSRNHHEFVKFHKVGTCAGGDIGPRR